MYRVYFIYPKDAKRFDENGLRPYVDWVKERLGDELLGYGCGHADFVDTQPIFGTNFRGLVYFDFNDRISGFDCLNKHDFVAILDKQLDFTDTPPIIQGVFVD